LDVVQDAHPEVDRGVVCALDLELHGIRPTWILRDQVEPPAVIRRWVGDLPSAEDVVLPKPQEQLDLEPDLPARARRDRVGHLLAVHEDDLGEVLGRHEAAPASDDAAAPGRRYPPSIDGTNGLVTDANALLPSVAANCSRAWPGWSPP